MFFAGKKINSSKIIIFALLVFIVVVLSIIFNFNQKQNTGNLEQDRCSNFGAPLVWEKISLDKFNNFWATKNGINQEYCENNGGTWGAWSKTWHSCYCAMSTPDAKKICKNSSECASGNCLYDASIADGKTDDIVGSCGEFKMQYPTPSCQMDIVDTGKLIKKNCVK